MNKYSVYAIISLDTGMAYIGITKNISARWKHHTRESNKTPNFSKNGLYHHMNKYGLGSFVFKILEELDTDNMKVAESHEDKWIKEFLEQGFELYNNTENNKKRRKKYRK